MKLRVKGRHLLLIMFCGIVYVYMIRTVHNSFVVSDNSLYEFDARLSQDTQHNIIKSCKDIWSKNGKLYQQQLNELKEQFPVLDRLSIRYQHDAQHILVCEALEPMIKLVIGKSVYGVTHEGRVLDASIFNQVCMDRLYEVQVSEQSFPHGIISLTDNGFLSEPYKTSIKKLYSELLRTYNVVVYGPYYVELIHKEQKKFTIIGSLYDMPSRQTIALCESIKNEREQDGSFVTQKNKCIITDVRFSNQIVLSSVPKGGCHG